MKANEVIEIIDSIPRYIQYIYPGFITIYLYYFFRGLTVKDTKGILLKSIIISYIYISIINVIDGIDIIKNINFKNYISIDIELCIVAVMIAYFAYRVVIYDKVVDFLRKLKINTTFSMNELEEIERDSIDGTWLCVYLKDSNVVYEGFLIKKEMEPDKKQFIVICKYRKYIIGDDGRAVKPFIFDYSDNKKQRAIIYFDEIKRFEIVDNTNVDEIEET